MPPTGKGQYKEGKGGVEYESGGVSTMVRRKESLQWDVREDTRKRRAKDEELPDTATWSETLRE